MASAADSDGNLRLKIGAEEGGLRARSRQRDLIDPAVRRPGRSRSDSMLEAGCREAEDVLLDQAWFPVDAGACETSDTSRSPAASDRETAQTPEDRSPVEKMKGTELTLPEPITAAHEPGDFV